MDTSVWYTTYISVGFSNLLHRVFTLVTVLVPHGASVGTVRLPFLHCAVPRTTWKDNSADIPERVTTVQLRSLRQKK